MRPIVIISMACSALAVLAGDPLTAHHHHHSRRLHRVRRTDSSPSASHLPIVELTAAGARPAIDVDASASGSPSSRPSAPASTTTSLPQGLAGLFVRSSPYFATAVAALAVLSFVVTLSVIWLIQCLVRRSSESSMQQSVGDFKARSFASIPARPLSTSHTNDGVSATPKRLRSPSHTIDGHLAPPPQYAPHHHHQSSSSRHHQPTVRQVISPPSRPLPSACPPYVDGPRLATTPRSAHVVATRAAPSPPPPPPSPHGESQLSYLRQ